MTSQMAFLLLIEEEEGFAYTITQTVTSRLVALT